MEQELDDSEETLDEIAIVFDNFGIDLPAEEFLNRCNDAEYPALLALDAIKERSLRLHPEGATGQTLVDGWDDLMDFYAKALEQLKHRAPNVGRKEWLDTQLGVMVRLDLGNGIADDCEPMNLPKIRLGKEV